jgi:hypothetical protein
MTDVPLAASTGGGAALREQPLHHHISFVEQELIAEKAERVLASTERVFFWAKWAPIVDQSAHSNPEQMVALTGFDRQNTSAHSQPLRPMPAARQPTVPQDHTVAGGPLNGVAVQESPLSPTLHGRPQAGDVADAALLQTRGVCPGDTRDIGQQQQEENTREVLGSDHGEPVCFVHVGDELGQNLFRPEASRADHGWPDFLGNDRLDLAPDGESTRALIYLQRAEPPTGDNAHVPEQRTVSALQGAEAYDGNIIRRVFAITITLGAGVAGLLAGIAPMLVGPVGDNISGPERSVAARLGTLANGRRGEVVDPHSFSTPDRRKLLETPMTAKDSDSRCRYEISCWAERHFVDARNSCQLEIEKLGSRNHEWIDDAGRALFAQFDWRDRDAGIIRYTGDSIGFLNSQGELERYAYNCDFDPFTGQPVHVAVTQKKLK